MRWLVRIVGALLLLGVLSVGALFAVPTDRIASIAAERIGAMTGRTVDLAGSLRPTIWPHLGVRAEGVTVGNPAWVEDGPLIAADALSVRVPWTSVFSGEVQLDEITLIGPDIVLVRRSDGLASWDFGEAGDTPEAVAGDATPEQASGTGDTTFGIDRLTIRDGRILYRDIPAGRSFRIEALQADIALPAAGPAEAEIDGTVNGTELEARLGFGDLAASLSGQLAPLTAELEWRGGRASFDGQASAAPALSGALSVDASDIAPLAGLAGQAPPALPAGFGRDRIVLEAQVTLAAEGTAHLRDARLTLDDTRFDIALDYLPGEVRPMLRGTVSSDAIDLSARPDGSGGAAGAAGGAGQSSGGWSTEPIDVSGLFAVDAELALALGSVDLGTTRIAPIEARVTLNAGRMVVDVARAGAFDGTLAGQFVVNGRGGLSTRADAIFAGVQLSPLFETLAGYDRLQGSGSISLAFLAIGDDMATLMRSMEGQGDLSFGAGAVTGLDIAGMIRNLDTSFRGEGARTVYDSVTANFRIEAGILSNDDLRLDAPWGEVTGAGTVDIGAQRFDYRIIPGLMRDEAGVADIRVPILVTGPWSDPQFRPDLEYLAEQELAEEAERLETEARARLEAEARERASELLGTELPEDATLEDAQDALEDRLREEAEDQLRRLLGGN